MDKVLNFLRKIPFGLLSALCVMFTYLVAGTIGLLIVPMLLCIFCVLPFAVLFAVLDIVIRKKKLVPIICLVFALFPMLGGILMVGTMAYDLISSVLARWQDLR